MWSKLSVIAAAAALGLAAPSVAQAQEAPSISLHGFADISVKNDYITPRGLHVTSKGTTIQALQGLVLDFARSKNDLITDVSVVGGTWMDWNPGFRPPNSQGFNEIDWFVGANVTIGQDWKAGIQYVEFISPQNAFRTEKNVELSLGFVDANYLKTVTFSPYVKLFYGAEGDSTVVTGRRGGTFDVEIGATPTINLSPYGVPLTLSAPTWVTVGPESFWGAGGGNVGVFSTGVKATYPLPLPPTAGHWSVYGNYQYYNLINDQLVVANNILNGETDRSVNVFALGLSLGF
jgi:hypothetical protein